METVIRVLIIYFFILIGLRMMGKREFSEMSPLELVTLLLLPQFVTNSVIREDFSLTNGFIAATTLLSIVFVMAQIQYLLPASEQVIEGKPVVLVAHGDLVTSNLNIERVTPGEVFSEMHRSGLTDLDQVKWAILETDGKIAIIPQQAQTPDRARHSEENAAL